LEPSSKKVPQKTSNPNFRQSHVGNHFWLETYIFVIFARSIFMLILGLALERPPAPIYAILNPAGCCRRPDFILTVPGVSRFLLACTQLARCHLDDRAFSAQRFSGGRAGRRFAPPSAVGGDCRSVGRGGASRRLRRGAALRATMGFGAPGCENNGFGSCF
jgi:hypothetical protein